MDKKDLTEADIRTKFITPALVGPGGKWNVMTQVREETYFTKGRASYEAKPSGEARPRRPDIGVLPIRSNRCRRREAIDDWHMRCIDSKRVAKSLS
jgi:hypothetical protein